MPKIFTEDDLKFAWQLYKQGRRLKIIAELLNTSTEEANAIVTAAYRRWGRGPRKTIEPQPQQQVQQAHPYTRPKAQYSNKSPYGISQPGI
jgi:hypothetical protein